MHTYGTLIWTHPNSMFQFQFWQIIYYYELTAEFSHPNFLPGCSLQVAWNHGDVFTYYILLTSNGKWKHGTQLMHNIVKPQDEDQRESICDYDKEDIAFMQNKPHQITAEPPKKRTQTYLRRLVEDENVSDSSDTTAIPHEGQTDKNADDTQNIHTTNMEMSSHLD